MSAFEEWWDAHKPSDPTSIYATVGARVAAEWAWNAAIDAAKASIESERFTNLHRRDMKERVLYAVRQLRAPSSSAPGEDAG